MRLETERLTLRRLQREDLELFVRIMSDDEAMRFLGGPVDRATTEAFVDRWLLRWEQEGFGHFVLERRDDGAFVGRAGLIVWDRRTWTVASTAEAGEHAQVELGWMLGRDHWGNGYATEAAERVRRWASDELDVESLVSVIHPDNTRSSRVAERLGAVPGETVVAQGEPAVIWRYPTGP